MSQLEQQVLESACVLESLVEDIERLGPEVIKETLRHSLCCLIGDQARLLRSAAGDEPTEQPLIVEGDGGGVLIDNHEVWEEARKNPAAARKAVAAAVQQAVLEAGGVPPELVDAVRSLGVGTIAGSGVYALRRDRSGCLDWKRLLRRYVGEVLSPQPAFDRPPRRCPELVGVLPGRRSLATDATVVAVIDTSGSISEEVLEQIDGELRRMSRTHTLHVVECDCVIHRVSRRVSRLGEVTGRGGTDFRPPLEPEFLRRLRADLVVYFTDGFGPAPEVPRTCPSSGVSSREGSPRHCGAGSLPWGPDPKGATTRTTDVRGEIIAKPFKEATRRGIVGQT